MRPFVRSCLSVCILVLASGSGLAQSDYLSRSISLNAAEKRALNNSLPPRVRTFLETAEEFVVFAQLDVIDGELKPAMDRELVPNFKAVVSDANQRKAVLKALYTEAAKDEHPSICYLPSHSIVAKKGHEKVTVEICFGCHRFYVSGSLGISKGTFSRSNGETERLVTKLVADLGITHK